MKSECVSEVRSEMNMSVGVWVPDWKKYKASRHTLGRCREEKKLTPIDGFWKIVKNYNTSTIENTAVF